MPTDPRRPGYHFTSPAGWINDPLGVTWREDGPDGGRYELFYQHNPDAPVWVPACRWGQASGVDLVRWREPRTALEPGPGETGCWSGSVVVDRGRPVIVYTSVLAEDPGQGRVALAEGDPGWRRWTPDPAGPVLGAPAPELGLAHVRDPFVWRHGDEWRMVLGAGSASGRPSVLQYSSVDLRTWRPDGVLVAPGPDDPGPGGSVWECPQLFPIGSTWALVVSVWDGEPGVVAGAVGDYDGRRFTPRSWQTLATAPCYATSAFLDARGRRGAFSWLQESGDVDDDWAGALSVPWLLAVEDGRLAVRPHPDIDTLRTGMHASLGPGPLGPHPVGTAVPAHADVVLRVRPDGEPLIVTLDEPAGRLLTVEADPAAGRLQLSVPSGPDSGAALRLGPDGVLHLRLLVDAGVVEAFSGEGAVAASRLRPTGGPLRLGLSSAGAGARLDDLVVHGMERVLG